MASTRAETPRRTEQLKFLSLELVVMELLMHYRIYLNYNGNNVHEARTSP